jgi:hypothetical protein
VFAEDFLEQLAIADVSFVVVGGLALQLHGFQRMTYDLDLVLAMSPTNLEKFITVAKQFRLRPTVPVSIDALKNPDQIDEWYREKGMLAFSLREPESGGYVVDVLVRSEVPFTELLAQSTQAEMKGHSIGIASVDHLLIMKRVANRPKDQLDVVALEKIQKGLDPNG